MTKFYILCLKQKWNTQNKDLPITCTYNTETIIGEIAHVLLCINTL